MLRTGGNWVTFEIIEKEEYIQQNYAVGLFKSPALRIVELFKQNFVDYIPL